MPNGLERMLRASCLALTVALCVPSLPGLASDTSALDAANRRWRGARCRTKQEITVKKKADGDGWSRSEWLWYGGKRGGNERVLVLFTSSAAIHSRYPGGTVPPGVDLVGVGWATEKPNGGGDLYLELEHPELGARARVYYYADWVGRVSVSRLAEFERWARLELFEILSTPEETLGNVDAPPGALAAPSTESGWTPAGPPSAGVPGAVELRVLAASVEPARVLPGTEAGLQIVYSVAGLAPGSEAEVREERVVWRNGATLTTLRSVARRAAGVHQSTQKLRLPGDLAPGVYELRARVESGGKEETGSAVFQVTAPGGR